MVLVKPITRDILRRMINQVDPARTRLRIVPFAEDIGGFSSPGGGSSKIRSQRALRALRMCPPRQEIGDAETTPWQSSILIRVTRLTKPNQRQDRSMIRGNDAETPRVAVMLANQICFSMTASLPLVPYFGYGSAGCEPSGALRPQELQQQHLPGADMTASLCQRWIQRSVDVAPIDPPGKQENKGNKKICVGTCHPCAGRTRLRGVPSRHLSRSAAARDDPCNDPSH